MRCLENRVTQQQFMETRRMAYSRRCVPAACLTALLSHDSRSHERRGWLDEKIQAAKRTSVVEGGKDVYEFNFVIGERRPVAVCEEAFFRAADISGGSRTSAMAAARAGRDRRRERLGEYRPPRQAAKQEEMLNWQVRPLRLVGSSSCCMCC